MKKNTNSIEPIRFEESKELLIAELGENYLFGSPMDPSEQWQEFGAYLGNIPRQKENTAYGLCIDLNNGKGIEYVCGVEVTDIKRLPEPFTHKELPPQKYAVFAHEGHISTIPQTCDAIWKEWTPGSGYEKPEDADFFFERYGEGFDPKKGFGDIEVWVPVKTKG
ncbi:MAG: GyrI-like domain-containing protein [Balneolales bacterium]